jgi:hypothetical protein
MPLRCRSSGCHAAAVRPQPARGTFAPVVLAAGARNDRIRQRDGCDQAKAESTAERAHRPAVIAPAGSHPGMLRAPRRLEAARAGGDCWRIGALIGWRAGSRARTGHGREKILSGVGLVNCLAW